MQLASVLLLALVLAASPASGSVMAGANSAVYKHMCRLIRIAEAKADVPEALPATIGSYADLQILNASLSSEEWRQQFAKKGNDKQRPAKPEGERASDQTWNDRRTAWLTAVEAVEKDADAKTTHKKLAAEPTPASSKQELLQQITPTVEAAAAAVQELQAAASTKGDASKAEAQNKLSTAVFSGAGKTAETTTADDLTTQATAQPPSGHCGGSVTTATVKCIAGLLICICCKTNNSNGIGGACNKHSQSNTAVSRAFTKI
uniref:Variant surface glycoprotein 1125.5709 n=1 Tax=Trypanosoma brucei TaxID=5691 RepID=A0A1J0RD38_9TRYP|nr:variant surface glycoprotein 1125.5709 [Trypanosoma brucei]